MSNPRILNPRPLRVAIVGCGHVGLAEHLPAIRQAGGEVVVLVDPREQVASQAAAQHRVPHAMSSLRDALRDVEFDVVAISASSDVHHEVAMESIAAGKHVYLEKPPTRNAREMAEVLSAAQSAGVCMIAGSNHPYRENVRHLRDCIAAGQFGKIYAIDCFKLRRAACPIDQGTETYEQGVGFYSSVHRLDVALFLLGSPEPESVCARTYNHFTLQKSRGAGVASPSGLVEDSIVATVHFRNGCTLTLRDIHSAHIAEPNGMQCWFGDMTIFGTHAGATLHPVTIYRTSPDGAQSAEVPCVDNDLHASHHPAYVQLLQWIRGGPAPEGTPDRALLLMRLIDALYASARSGGKQVRLDET